MFFDSLNSINISSNVLRDKLGGGPPNYIANNIIKRARLVKV